MKPRQRQAAILEYLQKQGKCSVEELAQYFDTTGTTIRKDLVILELGIGFANPGVIRFPFEKTAFFNQGSFFLRVNQTFPQTTEELKDRARGVHQNSVDWMIKSDYNVE